MTRAAGGLPAGRGPGGTVLCMLHRLHRWLTYRPERRYMRGR